MKEIRITFLALSRTVEMKIESEKEINSFVNDLLIILAKEIDYENLKINIDSLQQNTEEFRDKKLLNVKFNKLIHTLKIAWKMTNIFLFYLILQFLKNKKLNYIIIYQPFKEVKTLKK